MKTVATIDIEMSDVSELDEATGVTGDEVHERLNKAVKAVLDRDGSWKNTTLARQILENDPNLLVHYFVYTVRNFTD